MMDELGVWGGASGVFDRLCGVWMLDRRIEGLASLTGMARIERSRDGELLYEEQGALQLDHGPTLAAERRYRFRRAPAGFDVHFDEPPHALFHRIVLRATPAEAGSALGAGRGATAIRVPAIEGEAEHWCGDDIYASLYRFTDDGAVFIRHVVTGPRKAYISATTLFPASG